MKIAVVTGANRGIGLEVCRQLARFGMTVVLTARDPVKGKKAADSLAKENLPVEFFPLDITSEKQMDALADHLAKKFGHLDVLINNAAIIGSRQRISSPSADEIRSVMETNYFGPLLLTKKLIPLLKKSEDARIVNVSSGMGSWHDLAGSSAAYRLSKVGLNAMTVMLADDLKDTNIKVNSACPGWVQTEMGGWGAPNTLEQGADTIIWLATTKKEMTGKFFRIRREIPF